MSDEGAPERVGGMSKHDAAGDNEHSLSPLPTDEAAIAKLRGVRRQAAREPGPHGWWLEAKFVDGHKCRTVFICRSEGQALLCAWFLMPSCIVQRARPCTYIEEDGTEHERWLIVADDKPNYGLPVDLNVN